MDINEYWLNRRTVRDFTAREISDETIADMIDKAAHAPNTGNMQLYSVIVTRDSEIRRRLAPAHFNQPACVNAPLLLTFCADCRRFAQWCELSDATTGFDNFQGFVASLLDTTIFAQQFVTIAETSGLGCCYLGTTTYNAPQIADVLHLPKRVVPVTTIALGYPKGSAPTSDRLPVEAVMHKEVYHDATPDDIRLWYAEKEGAPENIRFVRENGKQTLAQVFSEVRYPESSSALFSRIYADFISDAGFTRPDAL